MNGHKGRAPRSSEWTAEHECDRMPRLIARRLPLPDATVEHRQSVRLRRDAAPGIGVDVDEARNAAVAVEHHELDQNGINASMVGIRLNIDRRRSVGRISSSQGSPAVSIRSDCQRR